MGLISIESSRRNMTRESFPVKQDHIQNELFFQNSWRFGQWVPKRNNSKNQAPHPRLLLISSRNKQK